MMVEEGTVATLAAQLKVLVETGTAATAARVATDRRELLQWWQYKQKGNSSNSRHIEETVATVVI